MIEFTLLVIKGILNNDTIKSAYFLVLTYSTLFIETLPKDEKQEFIKVYNSRKERMIVQLFYIS